MAHICDICTKDADPQTTEVWICVCGAGGRLAHEDDYYHERCLQKLLRAMPGKNYDPSRKSGFPCPRGTSANTQYAASCPGKITHCQKVVIKRANPAPSPSSAATAAAAQAAAKPAAPPKPKPKPKPPAAGAGGAGRAPQNTWVPTRVVVEEPPGPKVDPLGRNTAAAAAAAASKAAKKNAKRAAAKQKQREVEVGSAQDGSVSEASSLTTPRCGGPGSSSAAPRGSAPNGGWQGEGGDEAGSGDDEDDEDGSMEGVDSGCEGLELDQDQLLLLQLLREQKHKAAAGVTLRFSPEPHDDAQQQQQQQGSLQEEGPVLQQHAVSQHEPPALQQQQQQVSLLQVPEAPGTPRELGQQVAGLHMDSPSIMTRLQQAHQQYQQQQQQQYQPQQQHQPQQPQQQHQHGGALHASMPSMPWAGSMGLPGLAATTAPPPAAAAVVAPPPAAAEAAGDDDSDDEDALLALLLGT